MRNYLPRSLVRLRFLWIVLSLTTAATLLFVACGGGGTTASPTPTSQPTATATSQPTATAPSTATSTGTTAKVQIVETNGQYSFQPATLTIKKGTQVVWTNMSDAPHTVTSDSNAFNTASTLSQNQTFMFVFATAGTFAYHCNVHPYMKATITVTS